VMDCAAPETCISDLCKMIDPRRRFFRVSTPNLKDEVLACQTDKGSEKLFLS